MNDDTEADEHTQVDEQASGSESNETAGAPLLRVIDGHPTDEDVAVLTAVFAAASSAGAEQAPAGPRDLWGRNEDRLRRPWGAPSSFTDLRY